MQSAMKVFRPWTFQGSLRARRYFEGWYFKHVSGDRRQVWSFIPGISLSGKDRYAFIQVLNGITGEVWIFESAITSFHASRKELEIQVDQSEFNSRGLNLRLQNGQAQIEGQIGYSRLERYPSSLLRPGIMGWYSFVPFMECKHGIYSMRHMLSGGFELNGNYIDLNHGTGYIEKDWGQSFPESWIWLHCNTFENSGASFSFSVAKIPWLGSFFIGFISYLNLEDRLFNFSTWSRARIEKVEYQDTHLFVLVKNREYQLEIHARNSRAGKLKAPVHGSMKRIIKETVDASMEIILRNSSGKILFRDRGDRAGMELVDPILDYFKE
jgi:tocopherol cyclase